MAQEYCTYLVETNSLLKNAVQSKKHLTEDLTFVEILLTMRGNKKGIDYSDF